MQHLEKLRTTKWHAPGTIRELVARKSIGKTVSSIHLGEDDAHFMGQYVCFEFSDGSLMMLSFSSGSSFWVDDDVTARGMLTKPAVGLATSS